MPAVGCAKKSKVLLEMTRETVVISPEIESVTLDPVGRVDTRDQDRTIRVTMIGDPGLSATFDVEGRLTDQPMEEAPVGTYTGSFTLPRGETGELRVSGRVVDPPSGATQQKAASTGLTAWVSPPEPASGCTPKMAADFDARLQELTVRYDFDSWELPEEAKEKLRQQKDFLESASMCPIFILGHSDNVGRSEYNMRLSQRRAIHAGTFLITLGIEKHRLREQFLGDQHPEVDEPTPEARALNRRVEFRAVNPY